MKFQLNKEAGNLAPVFFKSRGIYWIETQDPTSSNTHPLSYGGGLLTNFEDNIVIAFMEVLTFRHFDFDYNLYLQPLL